MMQGGTVYTHIPVGSDALESLDGELEGNAPSQATVA